MEVRDIYSETEKLELHELHARKTAILNGPENYSNGIGTGVEFPELLGNYKHLSDDCLAELVAITRALRKKAASPGRTSTPRKPKAAKQPATLEDLA